MPKVHPTAVIDTGAEIHPSVEVGPFCYVEEGTVIGEGTRLESHVTIKKGTTLGTGNYIAQGAILGGDPQDRKYKGEPTYLQIGNDNVFREYVTVHRATGEGKTTIIGDRCFVMAYCHIGHNCHFHDDVTLANNVGCSGHVTIEQAVTVGGMTGFHQWVHVGKYAMVAGIARITRDCPPFIVTGGNDEVHDINAVGLRRMGITQENRTCLHKATKILFKSGLNLTNAIETVEREVRITPEVEYLLAYMRRLFHGKNGRGDQP